MSVRDYSSIYTIKEFIMNDVAPKYFDIDDLSLLNVGLFGMTTDIGATVAQDSFTTVSRFISEIIPGKSVLPEFVYAQAANYGITDIFAKCASCDATIFIREDHILEYGERDGNYTNYYIDSDMKVYIDNVPFSIPYDICIRTRYFNGTYNHNCTYCTSELHNDNVTLDYPYLKSFKTRISGQDTVYLAINVKLYQYNRRMIGESITSNNTLNIPYKDVSFNDNLCNFEVIYRDSEGGNRAQLKKLMENVPATSIPFCYYKMVDETTFRISFTSNDVYFVPEYKSELEIYIYETLGDKGNFPVYTGDNIYVAGSSTKPNRSYNNEVPLFCTMTSASVGGKNSFSLDDLSLQTWEAILSLKSRTTDEDLSRYFESYTALYGTKACFIKTRDDFASREYACYTRLRNENDIFPTNTLSLNVSFRDVTGGYQRGLNRYIVEPGKRIAYVDGSTTSAHILPDDAPKQDIEYTTIALMSIELEPNNIVYYMNSIDKTVPSEYKYINDQSLFQFILKSFNISRNAVLGEKDYKIKLIMLPTDVSVLQTTIYPDEYAGDLIYDEDPVENSEDPGVLNIKKMHVYLFADTADNHYIELSLNTNESSKDTGYVFECVLTTNDIINSSKIEITNLISSESGDVETCSLSIANPELSILAFYDDGLSTGHIYTNIIPDTTSYTLCNTFTPITDGYYLAYPLSLMRSHLSFSPSLGVAGFDMSVSSVPLFSRSFLIEDMGTNMKDVLNQVTAQHDFLQNALVTTTSQYMIHLMFFNTYGKSRIFSTDGGVSLDKTFCTLRIGIKLFQGVDDDCYNDIRNVIKTYIEGLNATDAKNINEFSVSNLFNILHKTFEDKIDAMKWYGINSYGPEVQWITMNRDLNASENIHNVPEFLTIRTEDIILTPLTTV